ncbi:contactin-associated protein-like 2 [Lates japonicus]|uniref:Contactin-associated protein-like 2 n=1 Tax=Lates japonicus TaxID=270547 RepID=A0AAD3MY49_LATJO|nr:contactin-associated protein-like 2 [Lates japonicus]
MGGYFETGTLVRRTSHLEVGPFALREVNAHQVWTTTQCPHGHPCQRDPLTPSSTWSKVLFEKVFETGQIDPIIIERYNTPGFEGCLSRVQFNSVAPLKAALRLGLSAPVSTHGILVPSNCGASPLTISPMASASDPWHIEAAGAVFPFNEDKASDDGVDRNSAIIGGIISIVIFTVLCIMVFVIRHMFRHKGSYHTNEAKGAESADCADAAIIVNDPAFTETIDESKKEWFI